MKPPLFPADFPQLAIYQAISQPSQERREERHLLPISSVKGLNGTTGPEIPCRKGDIDGSIFSKGIIEYIIDVYVYIYINIIYLLYLLYIY